jgi:hypothetical protein
MSTNREFETTRKYREVADALPALAWRDRGTLNKICHHNRKLRKAPIVSSLFNDAFWTTQVTYCRTERWIIKVKSWPCA